MTTKKRRRFERQFKLEAVRLYGCLGLAWLGSCACIFVAPFRTEGRWERCDCRTTLPTEVWKPASLKAMPPQTNIM